MKHELQKRVQKELDERIPRGRPGSAQNIFRMQVNAYRLHGLEFDESRAQATDGVRRYYDPAFVPLVLPPRPY